MENSAAEPQQHTKSDDSLQDGVSSSDGLSDGINDEDMPDEFVTEENADLVELHLEQLMSQLTDGECKEHMYY
jgi:hypothetical protein